jgi:hypothetical protein
MCNGYIGYVPTRQSHLAVNYNFLSPEGKPVRRGANLFMLEEGALELITDAATDSLKELFGQTTVTHSAE